MLPGAYLETVIDEYVRRLDVTMRDPDTTKVVKCLNDLRKDVSREVLRQCAVAEEKIVQTAAASTSPRK